MKAVVQDGYGSPDVLALQEVAQPAVRDDEVLVRVRAASVHPDVWHVVSGRPYVLRLIGAGLRRPNNRIPGTDMSGVVESVGANVTGLTPGDPVFGETVRGHQWRNGGAFAEYVSVREQALAVKPDNVTFEQAAAVPTAGLITLQNLPPIAPGQQVLVNGAAGGVGALAVQLIKAQGATVTGVDHPSKLDLLRSFGADEVIDYTTTDFTKGTARYDLIFDIPGNHSLSACRRVLTPTGKYVLIGHDNYGAAGRWLGGIGGVLKTVVLSPFVSQLPNLNLSPPNKKTLMTTLRDHLAAGTLTPTIDRTFPLSEAAAAIRYLASGNTRGKVILTVSASE